MRDKDLRSWCSGRMGFCFRIISDEIKRISSTGDLLSRTWEEVRDGRKYGDRESFFDLVYERIPEDKRRSISSGLLDRFPFWTKFFLSPLFSKSFCSEISHCLIYSV